MRKMVETTCAWCGKDIELTGKARRDARSHGRYYCSKSCRDARRSANISASKMGHEVTAETRTKLAGASKGKQYALGHILSPEAKVKIGADSKVRWADPAQVEKRLAASALNRAPTKHERMLFDALPSGWVLRHGFKAPGYGAGSMEIDIANPRARIAVELDGHSHLTPIQKARDARKIAWLTERGWWVVRIPQRSLAENLRLHVASCTMLADLRRAA